MQIQRKTILCCPLKIWAIALAWVHIILNCFTILLILISTIFFVLGGSGKLYGVTLLVYILTIALCLTLVYLGLYLIRAVQNQETQRMQTWMLIEGILLVLRTIGFVYTVIAVSLTGFIDLLGLLLGYVTFWVVLAHRRELLTMQQQQIHVQADAARAQELAASSVAVISPPNLTV